MEIGWAGVVFPGTKTGLAHWAPGMKGKYVMWERFSTSGLAGAYLDSLLAEGRKARMEFRPRRALDPYPFLVSLADEVTGEAFFTRPIDRLENPRRFEP